MKYYDLCACEFRPTVKMEQSDIDYIKKFVKANHFAKSLSKIKEKFDDPKQYCYFNGEKYLFGTDCEFFIGEADDIYETPQRVAGSCPSSYCGLIIGDEGEIMIISNPSDADVKWIQYLYEKFYLPKGYYMSGMIEFRDGENRKSSFILTVNKNKIKKTYLSTIEDKYKKLLEEEKTDCGTTKISAIRTIGYYIRKYTDENFIENVCAAFNCSEEEAKIKISEFASAAEKIY